MGKYIVKWLIVLFGFTILLVAYWFGWFSESFNTNLCYSEVLSSIREQVNDAIDTGNKENLVKIKKKLNELPLQGYESNCDEINKFVKNL